MLLPVQRGTEVSGSAAGCGMPGVHRNCVRSIRTEIEGSNEQDVYAVYFCNVLDHVESLLRLNLDHCQESVVGLQQVLGEAWNRVEPLHRERTPESVLQVSYPGSFRESPNVSRPSFAHRWELGRRDDSLGLFNSAE